MFGKATKTIKLLIFLLGVIIAISEEASVNQDSNNNKVLSKRQLEDEAVSELSMPENFESSTDDGESLDDSTLIEDQHEDLISVNEEALAVNITSESLVEDTAELLGENETESFNDEDDADPMSESTTELAAVLEEIAAKEALPEEETESSLAAEDDAEPMNESTTELAAVLKEAAAENDQFESLAEDGMNSLPEVESESVTGDDVTEKENTVEDSTATNEIESTTESTDTDDNFSDKLDDPSTTESLDEDTSESLGDDYTIEGLNENSTDNTAENSTEPLAKEESSSIDVIAESSTETLVEADPEATTQTLDESITEPLNDNKDLSFDDIENEDFDKDGLNQAVQIHENFTITTTTTASTTPVTSKSYVWFKPVSVPGYSDNSSFDSSLDHSSLINTNCPSLNCDFGYKTDLYGKPLCSCFNPCYEKKCGANICKIEKLHDTKYIGACYDPNQIERPVNCHLPLASGKCRDYSSRYYFNSFQKRCIHFVYTGCNGNPNNFLTWEKCHMECNTCSLPADKGPCHGNVIRYFYDSKSRECTPFSWGGCKGNENNFSSRKHCEESCIVRKTGALFLNGMPLRVIRKYHKTNGHQTE